MADIRFVVSKHGPRGYCGLALGHALTVYGNTLEELYQRARTVTDDPADDPGTLENIQFIFLFDLDSSTEDGTLYRHFRTGNVYVKLCEATDVDTKEVQAVYRNLATGEVWKRPLLEFNDPTRFEKVTYS